jgi:hypothetical protein
MENGILERFRKGINKFNSFSFYECHDILEDVWFDIRGPSRRFYQGLIHLAVGFYHILERENPKGAISQLSKGIVKLNDFKPGFIITTGTIPFNYIIGFNKLEKVVRIFPFLKRCCHDFPVELKVTVY